MKKNNQSFEKIIKKLQEDEDQSEFKRWNENLLSKTYLLLPSIVFLITFLKINDDKSIIDLLNFLFVALFLVAIGIVFNFFLTKK